MEASQDLLSAQIQFLDTKLALVHIPLKYYHIFLGPILQLITPAIGGQRGWPKEDVMVSGNHDHPFANVSITPMECSVVCSRDLVEDLFVPTRNQLADEVKQQIYISPDDYVIMQVGGATDDAGKRVLELTSPLAMAGVSIFFITTYFADYILVPVRSRRAVIAALEERNFIFEADSESYVSSAIHNRSSSGATLNSPNGSPRETNGAKAPDTPAELEARTFQLLREHQIRPVVDPTLRLISCAGRKHSALNSHGGGDGFSNGANGHNTRDAQDRLTVAILRCFMTVPHPRFISLTFTTEEPVSLVMQAELLPLFETVGNSDDLLLGAKDDILIPIQLNLRDLPVESTGIVCGVASKLVGATYTTSDGMSVAVDMRYLSTARAGTVIVGENEVDQAEAALRTEES